MVLESTACEVQELLQEALVGDQEENPNPSYSYGSIQRRLGGARTTATTTDPELEEQPEDDDSIVGIFELQPGGEGFLSIGFFELRCLWILFQCVWPAVVLSTGVQCHDENFTFWFVLPLVFVLMVVSCAKKNMVHEFGWKDFVPTVVWAVLTPGWIVDEKNLMAVEVIIVLLPVLWVLLTAILCFKHGILSTLDRQCRWLFFNCFVKPTGGRLNNMFRDMEEEYLEQQREKEESLDYQEQLKKQAHFIQQFEDRMAVHPAKTPFWAFAVLIIIAMWQVAFLIGADFNVLTKEMRDPVTTEQKMGMPFANLTSLL